MADLWSKKTNGVVARTDIGQHFMINGSILTVMAQQIPVGQKVVLEIGAGPGQLTERLATRAEKVVAIEIDERFREQLDEVERCHRNVEVIIDNVLKVDFNSYPDLWIVGNIPYHIIEPLMSKLIRSGLKGAVLLVGDSFAREVFATEGHEFGKLSMMTAAFFKPELILAVKKENFDPKPRTESAILKLVPLEPNDFQKNQKLFLVRQLFLTANKSPLVKSVLRESLIRFGVSTTKNEARKMVENYGIPETILTKPFEQLNNKEYLSLFKSLD